MSPSASAVKLFDLQLGDSRGGTLSCSASGRASRASVPPKCQSGCSAAGRTRRRRATAGRTSCSIDRNPGRASTMTIPHIAAAPPPTSSSRLTRNERRQPSQAPLQVNIDRGLVDVRRMASGRWMVTFAPDSQRYPEAKGWMDEHIPPTRKENTTDHVRNWAITEVGRRWSAGT